MKIRIRTLAPLCHGGFDGADVGNAVAIRREPIVGLPGFPKVPVVSGNAIRGCLRRIVMRDLFDLADLHVGTLPDQRWDLLYGALANGGHLTGSEKALSPSGVRELRAALPPLSIFGAALYRYMLPGRCRVGFAWPVCRQTVAAGLVGAETSELDAEDLVTEIGLVRHVDRDMQSPEISGVTPMPVTIEAIGTGATLVAHIHVYGSATPIERGAIAYGLDRLVGLGGKGSGGLGAVEVSHDGDASPYVAWLAETGAATIRDRLVALAGTLT